MTWSSCSIPTGSPDLTGILGGTFDPVHNGHLAAADQLRRHLGLVEVWLLPNATPPHRRPPAASAEHRLAMVRLAVAARDGLTACDLEVRAGGVSYTIDTVGRLAAEYPQRSFVWLLGYDAALQIAEWREPDAVLHAIPIAVFNRTGAPAPDWDRLRTLGFPHGTRIIEIDSPSIAAHHVRGLAAAGLPIESLVPPGVAAYIQQHNLYGRRSSA